MTEPMITMEVYVDANPKSVCYVAVHPTYGKTTVVRDISQMNCVEAEYEAILNALLDLRGNLKIYSDNQVVVKQLNHEYGIKEDKSRKKAIKIWDAVKERRDSSHETTEIHWISRKNNLAGKVLG